MKNNINYKKRLAILIFFILGLILILTGILNINKESQEIKINATPTLFLHGWGSSVNAEHQMTNAIVKNNLSNNITQAIVDKKGKVKLIGKINRNSKNPLIEVGFLNNRTSDYFKNGQWLKNVLIKLRNTYSIKKVNLVGHSMGNMAIMYYILANPNQKNVPQINKIIDIAGHFNGIIGLNDQPHQHQLNDEGKPNHFNLEYRRLLPLRKTFPNNIKVLNIFGDKNNGTNSDGSVTNSSSQSLKYLVAKRANSYHEKKIIGSQGQHSKLHESKQVDQILINFLWS